MHVQHLEDGIQWGIDKRISQSESICLTRLGITIVSQALQCHILREEPFLNQQAEFPFFSSILRTHGFLVEVSFKSCYRHIIVLCAFYKPFVGSMYENCKTMCAHEQPSSFLLIYQENLKIRHKKKLIDSHKILRARMDS